MTRERGKTVTTTGAFTDELQSLLSEAVENGIDVEGGWLVQSPSDERPDWDVEIWRVERGDAEANDR